MGNYLLNLNIKQKELKTCINLKSMLYYYCTEVCDMRETTNSNSYIATRCKVGILCTFLLKGG